MCTTNTQSPPPRLNKVSAIDLILSSAGAVQGFPTVQGVDLNVLGWINNTTTTFACQIVFQVKFSLSGITAREVALHRVKTRVATVMKSDGTQQQDTKTGDDGPRVDPVTGADVSVLRPSDSLIAVSDCPGYPGGNKWNFPMTYHASFDLYAFDRVSANRAILAKVSYVIDIQKKTFDDSSPTTTLSNVVKLIY